MNNKTEKVFGTDGIRGKVGEYPMTIDFVMRLASSISKVMTPKGGKVAIGKDTRISGYMFESALESAFGDKLDDLKGKEFIAEAIG